MEQWKQIDDSYSISSYGRVWLHKSKRYAKLSKTGKEAKNGGG